MDLVNLDLVFVNERIAFLQAEIEQYKCQSQEAHYLRRITETMLARYQRIRQQLIENEEKQEVRNEKHSD